VTRACPPVVVVVVVVAVLVDGRRQACDVACRMGMLKRGRRRRRGTGNFMSF